MLLYIMKCSCCHLYAYVHNATSKAKYPLSYFSTTGITRSVVYAILSGMLHIKGHLLLMRKNIKCNWGGGFRLSLSGLFLYDRRHITGNKTF